MGKYSVLLAVVLASACSKSGEESATTASASDTASGSEMSSQDSASATQPSDSSTYSSVTTTYSAPQTGTEGSTDATTANSGNGQQQSAAADATPALKPPQPGLVGPNGGQPTGSSGTQQTNDNQMANVDVEAIRSVLIREYPNRADMIRAITINEDNGIVTLRGLVYDESARPGIVAVVERTPGVKQVRDEMKKRAQ